MLMWEADEAHLCWISAVLVLGPKSLAKGKVLKQLEKPPLSLGTTLPPTLPFTAHAHNISDTEKPVRFLADLEILRHYFEI